TGEPVARRTRQVLQAADALAGGGVPGRLQLRTSGEPAALQAAAARWLGGNAGVALRWEAQADTKKDLAVNS
ncbi:MAG: Glutamate racemase, partial [Rhodoferax sp.]|nr:Glutamate racemase [Rhodoferax sp.]